MLKRTKIERAWRKEAPKVMDCREYNCTQHSSLCLALQHSENGMLSLNWLICTSKLHLPEKGTNLGYIQPCLLQHRIHVTIPYTTPAMIAGLD